MTRKTLQYIAVVGLALIIQACATKQIGERDEELERVAQQHLEYLASDRMAGRGTPSPELDSAAQYIAREFQSYGLEPIQESYFQTFNLYRTQVGDSNSLTIESAAVAEQFEIERDYSVFDFSLNASVRNVPLVFVGYGIQAPEFLWDDYQGIDVRNKFVVVLAGEPFSTDSTFFESYQLTKHAYTDTKLRAAEAHGAVGVLVIGDPRYNPVPDRATVRFSAKNPRPKSLRQSEIGHQKLIAISDYGQLRSRLFPDESVLNGIIEDMGKSRKSHSFVLSQTLSVNVDKHEEQVPVRNVVGVLRGYDSSQNSYCVVGAHYDHLGIESSHTGAGVEDSIYNGADDNASGTTGVLLAAQILARSKQRQLTSLVFVCFTAEEKGLYGSQYFVEHRLLPRDSCVAMINMDMIGRNHPDSISIGGGSHFPFLSEIAKTANSHVDRPFNVAENIEKFYRRGDQASFAKVGIPVVYFSSGLHSDYHQPTDELSKINVTKVARVARLCAKTAEMLSKGEGAVE